MKDYSRIDDSGVMAEFALGRLILRGLLTGKRACRGATWLRIHRLRIAGGQRINAHGEPTPLGGASTPGGPTVDELRKTRLRNAIELTLVPGVGSLGQRRLWTDYPDLSEVFTRSKAEIESMGIPPDSCSAIISRTYRGIAEEILDWGIREGYHIIARGDDIYPPLLAEIHDPPLVLYARGQVDSLQLPCLAMVGTRKPTFYGLQMAEGIAADLARHGVTIVSGLARGIDAASHRGCLNGQGRTIAVLGSGIDVVYPREHRQLTEKIAENGLLLSEFPPGTSPSPQNFPIRNRIISGLGLGALIVEASEYSGSLITARLTLEQNREVFAIPGNLTSNQSFGPNYLIKQGAKLVQCWRDIVEEFPPDLRRKILAEEDAKPIRELELDLLSEEELSITELLSPDRAIQFDKIYQKSGLAIPVLSDLLLKLEMKGRIRQVPGNMYVKVARPER